MKGKELIPVLVHFDKFTNLMFNKIISNLPEKGVSYKEMTDITLKYLLDKYLGREDFVSVANICFMIMDNREGL